MTMDLCRGRIPLFIEAGSRRNWGLSGRRVVAYFEIMWSK